jgi:hypothetical protein
VLQERDGLVGRSGGLGAVRNAVHCKDVVVLRGHCVDLRRVTILRDQLRLYGTG